MKKTVFFLFVIFSINLHAQSGKYAGTYEAIHNFNENGLIKYTLVLNQDGTFTFHNYRKISLKNPEENSYGKGIWKIEKDNTLYFFTEEATDLDDKYTLNFTNTKARYHTKPPRDKTDKIVKNHLRFYDSEIPWVKGWKLFKI